MTKCFHFENQLPDGKVFRSSSIYWIILGLILKRLQEIGSKSIGLYTGSGAGQLNINFWALKGWWEGVLCISMPKFVSSFCTVCALIWDATLSFEVFRFNLISNLWFLLKWYTRLGLKQEKCIRTNIQEISYFHRYIALESCLEIIITHQPYYIQNWLRSENVFFPLHLRPELRYPVYNTLLPIHILLDPGYDPACLHWTSKGSEPCCIAFKSNPKSLLIADRKYTDTKGPV